MSLYVKELFEAVRWRRTEAVKDLLAPTGNPNLRDDSGWTLLMAAVHSQNIGLVKFLLEWSELDINAKVEDPHDKLEFTALNIAMHKGNESIVQMLEERGAKRILVNLIPYAEHGHVEHIQRELSDGADIESRGISGYTPLLAALYAGQPQTARFLLERGANPRVRTRELADNGWYEVYSAFHCAAIGGCHELVEPLLREGLDLEERTEEGTPLILAAKYDHPEMIEALLRHGADVDRRNHETEAWGTTPLIAAASEGCFAAATTLIRHGASVDMTWSGGIRLSWRRQIEDMSAL